MRLFLDANVLFSAVHDSGGRAAALFEFAGKGLCELIASPHAIEEARRNLELKHPDLLSVWTRLLRAVAVCQECSLDNAAWARTQGMPDKDGPILGAAVQAGVDLLVTGDRTHFGHLYGRTLRGTLVVAPAEALSRVLAR